MDLLTEKWVPARSSSGVEHISLSEAMDRPIYDTQIPRADFGFALLLLAIGLKQTQYAPDPVFGSGRRFLQTEAALEKNRVVAIGQLLLDEPGGNAIKHNKDLTVRGAQRNAMCPSCATLALYTHTLFAGPGGAGLYPSNLFHSSLYLRMGGTLGETVEANLIDEAVPAEAYFTAPNAYLLTNPSGKGECALCGCTGPIVTNFYRAGPGAKPRQIESPHAAKTKNGKRFSIGPTDGALKIAEGASLDSEISIPPQAIAKRAKVGDRIIAFGTFYDKATLVGTFYEELELRPGADWGPVNRCISAVLIYLLKRVQSSDYGTTLAGEVRQNIEEQILHGKPEVKAALDVFEMKCPDPGLRNRRKYNRWRYFRNKIEGNTEAGVGFQDV